MFVCKAVSSRQFRNRSAPSKWLILRQNPRASHVHQNTPQLRVPICQILSWVHPSLDDRYGSPIFKAEYIGPLRPCHFAYRLLWYPTQSPHVHTADEVWYIRIKFHLRPLKPLKPVSMHN
ncbi:Protein of unknown function [Pyronema omphalodes CBS 100304]|uniref:Uncharacterized protein n=1 Tax=Pyronema omphalodes (strain CBS 100304) TaxID=1076935 RepID=U4LSI8_PYROM|nr:Protein of unknown function [Pyronema omphalodes CBS 100304]